MSQGLNSHVAVFGDLSHLYATPLSLYFDNLVVGTTRLCEQSHNRMSNILLAHRIPHNSYWKTWYRESAQTRKELKCLLPAMDNPSTILVIGHANSERPRERHNARKFLYHMIKGIRSNATNFHGKEVSVNGIELPPSACLQVTARRLIRFLYSSPLAADNNVIRYENITNQSITMALTSYEL